MSPARRTAGWPILLLTGLVAASAALPATAVGSAACSELEAAHRALLAGSFSVERTFLLTINGAPRMRERSRLSYGAGTLEREVLEREVLDDSLVLEEGEEDSALALPFACERLRRQGDDRYELSSADGTETVVFVLDVDRGALRPVSWRSAETTRFLWKKLAIEAVAEYLELAWR